MKLFWALFFASFLAMLGETMPLSFQPLFITGLGVTNVGLTLIYNIRNIIQTLLKPMVGPLTESLGKRNLLMFGLALFAFVPFLYSIATGPWVLIAAMIVSGFALSISFPPSEEYVGAIFPPEKVNEAIGRYGLSRDISSIVGPVLGGLLVSYFAGYRTILVFSGVLACLGFFIAWRDIEDDRERSCPFPPILLIRQVFLDLPSTLRRLLANRKVLVAYTAGFAYAFCHLGLLVFIPVFGAGRGFNEFLVGIVFTASGLMGALGLLFVDRVSDRVGRFLPIVIGLGVSVFAFVLIPVAQGFWVFLLLNAVLGVCGVLVLPASRISVIEALPSEDVGSGLKVWEVVLSFAGTVGMFVMSGVLLVASMDWVFYLSAVFTVFFMLIILWI
jgi:MFS family permease